MDFKQLTKTISQIKSQLNSDNYKDKRSELIELQKELSKSDLTVDQRTELRQSVQELFDRIKLFQEEDQQAFEKEADENFAFLKSKLMDCLTFVESNPEDLDASWGKLLETQDAFRGRKMRAEEREYLYRGLQQLFDVVKKRKDDAAAALAEHSKKVFESLDEEVADLVGNAETADIDELWSSLVETSERVRNSELVFSHRKRLLDSLQDGFVIAKLRKEERQRELINQSARNAELIGRKLQQAAKQLETNPDFKENWDLLIKIQQDFRELKFEKAAREELYAELQTLFETLKSSQDQKQSDFEQAANENFEHLQPLVEKALEQARKSQEFKKTKNFLIKVQSEFKGKRMRAEEREKLYSRLQSAFDTLNRRINEHVALRKEVREFRVDSKMSDVQKQIDDLETSIAEDMTKLQMFENKLEDSQILSSIQTGADNLKNQIEVLRAAIAGKAKQLSDLEEEVHKLQDRKDWLENI